MEQGIRNFLKAHSAKRATLGGITALELESFQSIREHTWIPLGTYTLLFGPNSAGKSAIADAIHFLREPEKFGDRYQRWCHIPEGRGPIPDLVKDIALKPYPMIVGATFPASTRPLDMIHAVIGQQDGSVVDLCAPLLYHDNIGNLLNDNATPRFITFRYNRGAIELDIDHEPLLSVVFSEEIDPYDLHQRKRQRCRTVWHSDNPVARAHSDISEVIAKSAAGLVADATETQIVFDGFLEADSVHDRFFFHFDQVGEARGNHPAEESLTVIEVLARACHQMFSKAAFLNIPPLRDLHLDAVQQTGPISLRTGLRSEIGMVPGSERELSQELATFYARGHIGKERKRVPSPRLRKKDVANSEAESAESYESELEALERINLWLTSPDYLNTGFHLAGTVSAILDLDEIYELSTKQTRLAVDKASGYRVALHLVDAQKRRRAFVDVGVGISQVLPVLWAASEVTDARMVFIQQPELHLHPKLQSKLGDVFASTAEGRRNQIVVETHSEHLLLRILRRIRDARKRTKRVSSFRISSDDVVVLYVQLDSKRGALIRHLRLAEDGEFLDPWPDGFFEERDEDLFDG